LHVSEWCAGWVVVFGRVVPAWVELEVYVAAPVVAAPAWAALVVCAVALVVVVPVWAEPGVCGVAPVVDAPAWVELEVCGVAPAREAGHGLVGAHVVAAKQAAAKQFVSGRAPISDG
jgi:hypothetical protein